MSDGSDYCRDIIDTLTNEQEGIEFVRNALNRLLREDDETRGYDTNTEPSVAPYNFNNEDMTNILAHYRIQYGTFYTTISLSQLNLWQGDLPPVILLNVSLANINDMGLHRGNHWVVLYRTADFPGCRFLAGIQDTSDEHRQNMEHGDEILRAILPENLTLNSMPDGYGIYYPRYKGDCGPDAVRVIMLLYCCLPSPTEAVASRVARSPTSSPNKANGTPISPLTPNTPAQKKQLEDELTAIFRTINQPELISLSLENAAKKVAKDIQFELDNIRRSARLSNKRAREADTKELEIVDAKDKDINEMAKLLVPSTGMSSSDSVGSQFSQQLLDIAQRSGILPPKSGRGASQYNDKIKKILSKLGGEYEGLIMRDVYSASKYAKAIDEVPQFTNVWGEGISDHVKENGFCYLSGEVFVPNDYPEMDHVKFATSAIMECIHYRDLLSKTLCGIKVSKLWQDFINTQPGINLLWTLYQKLNLGTINKEGSRVYSERDVNTCYERVFNAFKKYIQTNYPVCDIDIPTFNYSTSMLKFWLAEFAYALHLFNQAKGGLNLNDPIGIKAMNRNVRSRADNASSDPKTSKELSNHPQVSRSLLTKNNSFIAARVRHLEQIAAEFKETGYGCVSNLTPEQLDDSELVSVIILMKQLRNILLYSQIQYHQITSSGILVADDIDASITNESSEEANLNNRLIELQNEIETLQHKLTTNIRYASRSRTKLERIQTQINTIIDKKGVSQEELGNLINLQEDLGNLITSQQAIRGLFGTGRPAYSDEDEWEMMPAWSGSSNKKKGGTLKNKRRTQKRIASRRRKRNKRSITRRKRYTRKQKK